MDILLIKLLKKARSHSLLIRFTLGLRILLAIAFMPTGMVKLMGRRFTSGIPEEGSPLVLFEALYLSGMYWQFLGAAQVLAGFLLLFYRTSAIGALFFLAIASNILFITISYDFGLTIVVSCGIALAALWLMFWHWDRIRFLFIKEIGKSIPLFEEPILTNKYEKGIYILGLLSGLTIFSVLRGLEVPIYIVYASVLISFTCFILAIVFGIRNMLTSKH